jgi:hypothetical protein
VANEPLPPEVGGPIREAVRAEAAGLLEIFRARSLSAGPGVEAPEDPSPSPKGPPDELVSLMYHVVATLGAHDREIMPQALLEGIAAEWMLVAEEVAAHRFPIGHYYASGGRESVKSVREPARVRAAHRAETAVPLGAMAAGLAGVASAALGAVPMAAAMAAAFLLVTGLASAALARAGL